MLMFRGCKKRKQNCANLNYLQLLLLKKVNGKFLKNLHMIMKKIFGNEYNMLSICCYN